MRADARTPRRGLSGRLAARTPQERAAASVANGIAALVGYRGLRPQSADESDLDWTDDQDRELACA